MMTKQNKHLQKPTEKSIPPRVKKVDRRLTDKFHAYLVLHAHTLFSSLGKIISTPLTSVMTIMVLAISIALASSFYLLLANAEQLTGNIEASNQISLFLKSSVSDSEGRSLVDEIKQWSNVKMVDLITQDSALAEFRDYSGFGSALNVLETNPLPAVIQVLPRNALDNAIEVQGLMDDLERLNEVDIVQMDMQWVQRLQSMMDLAKQGVILLTVILSFAVLFITGNTIRLELENRRDEVLIAKLVGATDSFIQRPFLYTGFWFGLFAGVIAWFIVTVMTWILKAPIERLTELYDHHYQILFLSVSESLMLWLISSFLGGLGSWIVLRYQLKQVKLE